MNINTKSILIGLVELAGSDARFNFFTDPMPEPGEETQLTGLAEIVVDGVLGAIAESTGAWTLTLNSTIPDTVIPDDGVCTWARLASADGIWVADFTVTAFGGGGDFVFRRNNTIYANGTLTLANLNISVLK